MSVWSLPVDPQPNRLAGVEGELISVRISVEPQLLENLLETLAELPFPVNPQLQHLVGDHPVSVVEFPAYDAQLAQVRQAIAAGGFPPASLQTRSMLSEIRG